jgi:1-acyl-sn-glycerol-3-phosphate acyltransferase
MIYAFSRFLCILFFKLVCKVEVKGRDNIPEEGGFILASNHVSYLDPVAVGSVCPRRLNYMARHDLFTNPIFSWLLHQYGVFPVKRNYADISALKEALVCVKKGGGLLLFPEGTRSQDGRLSNKAEPGIGFLAAKLNVPVIPVFVKGTEKALPRGAKFIVPAKVAVCFGKQIHIERRMPYQDIAQLILDHIRHLSC